jgi:restriction system protein
MSENSLFAVLLRSPWWASIGLALALGLGAHFTFPKEMAAYAPFIGFPFLITGVMAAWKQSRVPSAARVAATLEAVGAMSWREFSVLLDNAFRQQGYVVRALPGPAADFALDKEGRTALVSCKRWKAATHGVEALRDLEGARAAQGAHECLYVAAGSVSDKALRYAGETGIRVLQGQELALLLPKAGAAKVRA